MKPLIGCAALLLLLAGCRGCSKGPEAQVLVDDASAVNDNVKTYISTHLASIDSARKQTLSGDTLIVPMWMKRFYLANGSKPAWTDKGKLSACGDTLFGILRDAVDWGLIREEYHYTLLDSLVHTAYDSAKKEYNVNKLAQADMLLTDGFFTFAVHAGGGRMLNDSATTRGWFPQRIDSLHPEQKLQTLITQATSQNKVRASLESIEPQSADFKAVKRFLPIFRKKYANAKWDKMPDAAPEDSSELKAAMRKRLIDIGDYDSTETVTDASKAAQEHFRNALKKFQKRYALEPDGRIGRNTVKAMNMTVEDRIRQMAIILERWRIEPKRNEKAYIWVNLPAFRMKVVEADTIVMQSRIVCGAPKTQTPELDSKMYQMVLYPYWNVPWSIIKKEMIPAMRRDSAYLRKQRLEVIGKDGKIIDPSTINWKKISAGSFPYKLRQKTGDDNALGILKFEFNNPFGVYMHDTNSHSYFGRETRALSHGCMRLEKFMDLAYYLIRDDSVKMPKDTFDIYIRSGHQRRINVKKPLPIHVRYFTADVDTAGNVMLLGDIYDRDLKMIKVIYAKVDAAKKVAPASTSTSPSPKKASTGTSGKLSFRYKDEYLELRHLALPTCPLVIANGDCRRES